MTARSQWLQEPNDHKSDNHKSLDGHNSPMTARTQQLQEPSDCKNPMTARTQWLQENPMTTRTWWPQEPNNHKETNHHLSKNDCDHKNQQPTTDSNNCKHQLQEPMATRTTTSYQEQNKPWLSCWQLNFKNEKCNMQQPASHIKCNVGTCTNHCIESHDSFVFHGCICHHAESVNLNHYTFYMWFCKFLEIFDSKYVYHTADLNFEC